MTDFCKTLAELCQTANITMDEAFEHTTAYKTDAHNTIKKVIENDFIPEEATLHELATYFGIGIGQFFKSPHASKAANKVYVAGPITGYPNFMQRFDQAHAYLQDNGYKVFNPARVTATLPASSMTRQNFMDLGLQLLAMCNAIALIPGWEASTGCQMERAYAVANQMRVINLTEQNLADGLGEINKSAGTKQKVGICIDTWGIKSYYTIITNKNVTEEQIRKTLTTHPDVTICVPNERNRCMTRKCEQNNWQLQEGPTNDIHIILH